MATTTNYGWTTPDDTSLVKDGASAIRTLGTSIDTTTYNNSLLPIVKTIVDAKGDIIAATAADTVSRLAVGANDTVLTADSTAATGLKWASANAGGMTLISTTTLTGASVTLSSIPSTYKNLQLIVRNYLPVNDGNFIQFRFNADATASRHAALSAISGIASAFGATAAKATAAQDNATATGLVCIDVFDYTNTSTWKFFRTTGISNDDTTATSVSYISSALGAYNQITAISSIELFASSSNFTSGTVLLYGVK
jgi:hypothetical protein